MARVFNYKHPASQKSRNMLSGGYFGLSFKKVQAIVYAGFINVADGFLRNFIKF